MDISSDSSSMDISTVSNALMINAYRLTLQNLHSTGPLIMVGPICLSHGGLCN